jgi:hypothetical protein
MLNKNSVLMNLMECSDIISRDSESPDNSDTSNEMKSDSIIVSKMVKSVVKLVKPITTLNIIMASFCNMKYAKTAIKMLSMRMENE